MGMTEKEEQKKSPEMEVLRACHGEFKRDASSYSTRGPSDEGNFSL